LTNEEVERRGGKSTALYQYLSYKEKRYWMALFDGYADNEPKFKKDGVEIDYKSFMPTSVCDKMALGRYCQFGLNGKVQPGYRMLKLSDRISELMPPKLKFGRDEMQWLFRIILPAPKFPLSSGHILDELQKLAGKESQMRKNKWNTMYELSVEAKVSEQVKEAIYEQVSNSIVYVRHEAMHDVFGKKVTYNGGGGDDERLPYYDFKYCASEPEDPNSDFCIYFLNAMYGFNTKEVHYLEIHTSISVLLARMGFFQHIEFVKRFIDGFKCDEAGIWFQNENSWKKTLEVKGIEKDTEAQDRLIVTGGVKALLQPHVMFTYHVVEWFGWALLVEGIQNSRIGLVLISLAFEKERSYVAEEINQESKEEGEFLEEPYGEEGYRKCGKIPKLFDSSLYPIHAVQLWISERDEVCDQLKHSLVEETFNEEREFINWMVERQVMKKSDLFQLSMIWVVISRIFAMRNYRKKKEIWKKRP
jgi:hypothetical protein